MPTFTPKIRKLPKKSFIGILYFAAGMFLFAAVDTMAKVLTESFHPLQVAWSRQLGLFMGIVILLVIKGTPQGVRNVWNVWNVSSGV